MPAESHFQAAFLGGEWGPVSYGRADLPGYNTALKVNLNGIVTEQGAWTRRSGFEFIVPARSALPAKLLPYYTTLTPGLPYVLELTDNWMRFMVGTRPVFTTTHPTVTASSLAAGILSLTATTTNIIVGDDLMLWSPDTFDPAAIGPWRGRVLRVKTVGGGVITVGDEAGNAFVGLTSSANALVNCVIYQMDREAAPWATQPLLQHLRIVPTDTTAIILSPAVGSATVFPQLLNLAATPRLVNYPFVDGPYLDPQGTLALPETGTLSARTGSVTFTPLTTVFTADDVNRLLRFFNEPPQWASGTTYAYGDIVTYNGEYWVNVASGTYAGINHGVIPGTSAVSGNVQVTVWAPAPVGGTWSWGTITAQAGASCTVTMGTSVPTTCSLTCTAWRLGVYKWSGAVSQLPTCGIYSDGRLFLGGAVPNRWDASAPNQPLVFSPTDPDGLVQDANAISYVMVSDDPQPIAWFKTNEKGLLVGTLTAEWLIAASTQNEALTPTSAKATQVTHYGGLSADAIQAGSTVVFVQRYGQRLMEFLSVSAFSSRFGGRHLNKNSKHISTAGITEIAYQEEKVPTIWCRMGDGSLAGVTYRRVSPYLTEPPEVEAWGRQVLGGDYAADLSRLVVSMAVRQNEENLSDLLYVCTTDVNGAHAWIEVLRPVFEDA